MFPFAQDLITGAPAYESATALGWRILVPLAIAEICLLALALFRWARTPADRFTGNRWVWLAAILLLNFIGAITFLFFGRRPAAIDNHGRIGTSHPDHVADVLYGKR
ncbi:hypothetical protein KEM60_00136 [Austwickia sp. TVS 96-490-7B]|uniref:PLD nuclease N-terminal domain-containing protein n=1 Tax=Austwickia sp. TVS 96-490-7B TaxID=2830843 RepID=UPI001C592942|nr:PLD nuclease N-terminal domain-containing protein [Austwickia sp. TVS 96-490-7B]MBW3083953.1 hypothetical protein [Austwickia sp. TVS 96-490-7B]